MNIIELLLGLPDYQIKRVEVGETVQIEVHGVADGAACPSCGAISTRVHSRYWRTVNDLPICARAVAVTLLVRRFRCRNETCKQRIFAERFPGIAGPYAQQTRRMVQTVREVGHSLGGEAGARLLCKLHMKTSPDTVLRRLRARMSSAPDACTGSDENVELSPKVIGVDDWAWHRGHKYGTVIVDLERRCPVALLADRTAETLAAWLRAHPGVCVIARDRSTEFARGASNGAPTAIQVADRWHLLQNLRQALHRLFLRLYPQVAELFQVAMSSGTESEATNHNLAANQFARTKAFPRTHGEQTGSNKHRADRLVRYQQIKQLQAEGLNIDQIRRRLSLTRTTVRKYYYAEQFPERARRKLPTSILDPYLKYLDTRRQQGCENGMLLWREIAAMGFPGTHKQVLRWLQQERSQPALTTPKRYLPTGQTAVDSVDKRVATACLPSPKQLAWLFMCDPSRLTDTDATTIQLLCQDSHLSTIYQLVRRYVTMIRQRAVAMLDPWLAATASSNIRELQTFASGLRQDYPAVRAALEYKWSNGQTEGQVNRLKLIKRQMFGRAKLDLLTLRFLPLPP